MDCATIPSDNDSLKGNANEPVVTNKTIDLYTVPKTTENPGNMDELVRKTYRERFCTADGVQKIPVHFERFRHMMLNTHSDPNTRVELKFALRRFDKELYTTLLERFTVNEQGEYLDCEAVFAHVQSMRPDMDKRAAIKAFDSIRAQNAVVAKEAPSPPPRDIPPVQQNQATAQAATASKASTIQPKTSSQPSQVNTSILQPDPAAVSSKNTEPAQAAPLMVDDILTRKLRQLGETARTGSPGRDRTGPVATARQAPDFQRFEQLLVARNQHISTSTLQSSVERSVRQAPLLTADIIASHYNDLVPQYGLLGSLADEEEHKTKSQLFLNTNVPFSAFICGVQGSGKSHTTSCILENAVLASANLGHLQTPASILVFNYGEWSIGGAGFNISEVTFLGGSHPDFPGSCVKEITVLYSPSNAAIKRLYERLPNVKMVPFRLKARTLDITALHTLMAVDEKSTVPLYMATVETILRDISSKSEDGSLDYLEFKRRLAKEKFDSVQTNMLKMRMNLLESFLNLSGTAPGPSFNPGEVTIIDLSDPFVTSSTACILFKLGLEQFLQSRAPSKMVVLDEAHKYMLDSPGLKILTDHLTRVIRLQRHQGARVVISTQEPTIATELIALCSVVVMHRFTSLTWYAALRRRINVVDDDKAIMQHIESLETGEALVYSPNAVLGKNEDGSLIKAIGRMLKMNVRSRVTLDGGASIMAV